MATSRRPIAKALRIMARDDEGLKVLQRNLDAINSIRAALSCLCRACDELDYYIQNYEFVFEGQQFKGLDPKKHAALCYLPSDDYCIYSTTHCEWVPKWVNNLWEALDEAEAAISAIPTSFLEVLSQLAERPWRPMVREQLLNFVTVWPDETLTYRTLGSKKVSNHMSTFLDHFQRHDPRPQWREYQRQIDKYQSQLVAVRDETMDRFSGATGEVRNETAGPNTDESFDERFELTLRLRNSKKDFEHAADEFREFRATIDLQNGGPHIHRFDVTAIGNGKHRIARDEDRHLGLGSKYDVITDDAERIAFYKQDCNAFWRMHELCKLLVPLLTQAGIALRDGERSTPEGQVLLWALGESSDCDRKTIASNDNSFLTIARAIGDRVLPRLTPRATPRRHADPGNECALSETLPQLLAIEKKDGTPVDVKLGDAAENPGPANGNASFESCNTSGLDLDSWSEAAIGIGDDGDYYLFVPAQMTVDAW